MAAVFHGLFLILESLSSAEFGRRPKCSSGFRLAANSFAIDQWAFLRQLGVPTAQEAKEVQDDDRCPKWDTALPTTKKEWKTSIYSMKREASALTEPKALAPFRASLFPSCLLHAEADLKTKGLQRGHSEDKCGGRLWPGARPLRRNGLLRPWQGIRRDDSPS
jgi:hypothetical protein